MKNSVSKLYRYNLIKTLGLKENLLQLFRRKNIYLSNVDISRDEKLLSINTNIFFPTEKVLKLKRSLVQNRRQRIKKQLLIRSNLSSRVQGKNRHVYRMNKNLFIRNMIVKFRVLNADLEKIRLRYFFNKLKRFRYSLFNKRYSLFFDMVKVISLISVNKGNLDLFSYLLGVLFRTLHKKKHKLFISFLKHLANCIIDSVKNLNGIKIVINGKIQGKVRAKTVKIQAGRISITNLGNAPQISKVHVFTVYGAYGIHVLVNYNNSKI